jgi:nucleotide-binding universal stress UspA family protein
LSVVEPPLVVGVDGSERSRDALALAARLAEPGQRVVLVYCHPYARLSSLLEEGEYEQLVRDVAASTFEAVQDILDPAADREMRLLSNTSPASGLHDVAKETNASAIVIGSSHRSGLGRVLAGSVAESVLVGSPVPAAIAPHGYAVAGEELASIGCGFDGSPESREALGWASALASRWSAHLQVLGVHVPIAFSGASTAGAFGYQSANDALRGELKQQLREALVSHVDGSQVSLRLLEGDAATALTAASADLDLLVLGSRGYGSFRSVVLGSVSRALVRSAACPVVVLPRGLPTDHKT